MAPRPTTRARNQLATNPGRGGASLGRGRGGQTQGESISTTSAPTRIQWEGKDYTYRTNLLISFCRDNPDLRLKLFSDSTQDAIEQGRTRKQMSANKDNYYKNVAEHVFMNDPDPAIQEAYEADSTRFVGAVRSRFVKYVFIHRI